MKVKAVRPWPFWIIHLLLVVLYTPGSTLLTQPGKNLQRTMETEYMDSDQKDNTDVCSIMRTPLRFWMVVYRQQDRDRSGCYCPLQPALVGTQPACAPVGRTTECLLYLYHYLHLYLSVDITLHLQPAFLCRFGPNVFG